MVERSDVEAALQARHELGPEYDPQIVDALAEKIEKRLDERLQAKPPARPRHYDTRLPIVSMVLGVGATAVATSNAHGAGGVIIAIFAWLAIAVVNVAYAMRR